MMPGKKVQDRKILCSVVDASFAITYTTDNNTIKQHVTCDSVRVEMCECSFTRPEPENNSEFSTYDGRASVSSISFKMKGT